MAAEAGRWLLDHLWPPPPDELSDVTETDPLAVYSLARSHGWSVSEASNLAAYLSGLRVTDGEHAMKPWTMRAVLGCHFLRLLYQRGTWSPTRTARTRRG